MLAGRASLVCWVNGVETKITEARILATWTDNEVLSAQIDRRVAHYTGQAELAQTRLNGLEVAVMADLPLQANDELTLGHWTKIQIRKHSAP